MNFKHLRSLIAVLEEGSFSAAAEHLNIVQPALSQHIISMERELGVKLFIRTNRGVEITPEGERLVHHARLILQQVEIARNDLLVSQEAEPAGDVIIALPITMTALLSPRLLVWLERHYPRVNVRIVEGMSSESGHVVETGKVEIGVIPNAAELDGVETIPVLREYFYFMGHVDRPEASFDDISFAEAAAAPLILGDRSLNLRRVVDEHALTAGATLNVRYNQNAPQTLGGIVDSGLACTIANVAYPMGQDSRRPRFVRRIVDPEVTRTVAVAWPRRRPLSRAAECVCDGLITLMKEAAEAGDWRADVILTSHSHKI